MEECAILRLALLAEAASLRDPVAAAATSALVTAASAAAAGAAAATAVLELAKKRRAAALKQVLATVQPAASNLVRVTSDGFDCVAGHPHERAEEPRLAPDGMGAAMLGAEVLGGEVGGEAVLARFGVAIRARLDNDFGYTEGSAGKKRWRPTKEQREKLTRQFDECSTPTTPKIMEIAAEFGVAQRTIRVWFQNRRQRLRGNSPEEEPTEVPALAIVAASAAVAAATPTTGPVIGVPMAMPGLAPIRASPIKPAAAYLGTESHEAARTEPRSAGAGFQPYPQLAPVGAPAASIRKRREGAAEKGAAPKPQTNPVVEGAAVPPKDKLLKKGALDAAAG
ncbi:homeobox domain-containing protein [Pavlovales sp. CCMP2436]|nr:homeobox domain-containing protein [Pavlovales sp. CCMP2436]